MNKQLHELKKETNYCAGTGEIACLLEQAAGSVVLVNGPRFCYLQMKRILKQILPLNIEDRLYCSDIDENAIVFGTESKVKKALRQIKKQEKAINLIGVVNSCAVSLIGDDILGIVAEELPGACCISLESGAMTGDFWDGYKCVLKLLQEQAVTTATQGCLRGYSLCYYNAYYDAQEMCRLLAQGLKLQKKDFPALAGELCTETETAFLAGVPYGYYGTWQWLEGIAGHYRLASDGIKALQKQCATAYQVFANNERSLIGAWGRIYFPVIVIAAPEAVAYALAKAVTMELADYDKMYVIVHGKAQEATSVGPYLVVEDMEAVLQKNGGAAMLVMGSSVECEQYMRYAGHRPYFVAVSQPVYDDISSGPLVGIKGFYNLKKLLWQQYIQSQYDAFNEARR